MSNEKEELKMDFSGFILSLNASALIHLGEIPDPHSKTREVNIPAAKHTISHLEILAEKTAGPLTEEEKTLLDDMVYNIRMKYVKSLS
ncbi:MAG: DUF1844 domain-containing protein [Candidatus Dadabacteria bacterium]|nr:DUF1844 domain-containing protein [Candidatus Dadabacteria bacterium]